MLDNKVSTIKIQETDLLNLEKDNLPENLICFGYLINEIGIVQEGDLSLLNNNEKMYFVAFATNKEDMKFHNDVSEAMGIFPIQKILLANDSPVVKFYNFISAITTLGNGNKIKESIEWKTLNNQIVHTLRFMSNDGYLYHMFY
jgi:hypothetical protein